MAEEMREHVEYENARRVAAGEDPVATRRHAAIDFGPVDSLQERVRNRRLGHSIENGYRLVRIAWRRLQRSPGFSLVAVATIAIGIGAGTAVFSLVDPILRRSLPVPDPQQLRLLYWTGNADALDQPRFALLTGGPLARRIRQPPRLRAVPRAGGRVASSCGQQGQV